MVLHWFSSLCRWALAMQGFDFIIKYRKGCHNGNADALSRNLPVPRVVAATQFVPGSLKADIQQAQQADPTLQIPYSTKF